MSFKIAFRSLWKNKISSTINILGLTVGLSSSLLIALYVQNELSYDQFQPNAERIARVIMEYRFDGSGQSNKGNFTSIRVPKVFRNIFPEVESAVIMAGFRNGNPQDNLLQKNILVALGKRTRKICCSSSRL